jgi:hypothetical protein
MAHSKQAGQSTRDMAERRRRTGIWWGLGGIVAIVIIYFIITNPDYFGIGGGAFLGLILLMKFIEGMSHRQMRKQSKLERRAIRGAKGEETVGSILQELDEEEFEVFHDVECPNGNIDHLVLSKTQGIFLIETKAHGGRVEIVGEKLLVNGKDPEKDFIAQTLRNTYWVRDQLQEELGIKVWVQPVIVFTNAFVKFGKPVKGIHITNKKYLLDYIQRERKPVSNAGLLWEQRENVEEILI